MVGEKRPRWLAFVRHWFPNGDYNIKNKGCNALKQHVLRGCELERPIRWLHRRMNIEFALSLRTPTIVELRQRKGTNWANDRQFNSFTVSATGACAQKSDDFYGVSVQCLHSPRLLPREALYRTPITMALTRFIPNKCDKHHPSLLVCPIPGRCYQFSCSKKHICRIQRYRVDPRTKMCGLNGTAPAATRPVRLLPLPPPRAHHRRSYRTGAVANFEAQVWQSTSVAKASSFHKISEHAGNSVAVQTTSSKGGSASASAPFGSVSGSHSTETEDGTGGTNVEEGEGSSADQTTTSTATVIECE